MPSLHTNHRSRTGAAALLVVITIATAAGCASKITTEEGEPELPVRDAAADRTPALDASTAPLDAEPPPFSGSDADAAPAACIGDLSGVLTGDFRLTFTVITTATRLSALIDQRADNCRGSGLDRLWDCRLQPTGFVTFEWLDGAKGFLNVTTLAAPVNDGVLHKVGIFRKLGQVYVTIDEVRVPTRVLQSSTYPTNMVTVDTAAPSYEFASSLSMGPSLPPLKWTDSLVCTSDGTVPLVGTVTPDCIAPIIR